MSSTSAPRMSSPDGRKEEMSAWISSNDVKVLLQAEILRAQAETCSSDLSVEDSDQSLFFRPWSSGGSVSSGDRRGHVPQLEGLFQIPEKHLLPGMTRYPSPSASDFISYASSQTSLDSEEEHCEGTDSSAIPPGPAYKLSQSRKSSRYTFDSTASSACSARTPASLSCQRSTFTTLNQTAKEHPSPDPDSSQRLTGSVLAIRHAWASLEANRGIDKHQISIHLITQLSKLISLDGCTLFEYHISHLLAGSNHSSRMQKLWLSLSAGQKTYWRKHSAKFQLPLAFEYWQLALRNLETDDHSGRYSSLVRKAKRVLEDASVEPEGHIIASPNWRHPVPERELQLCRLDEFSATRKIQRKLHSVQLSYGPRRNVLCRHLASFIAGSGWTMFAYHGIPRVEEMGEMDAMAKLRAVWNGMTADDRLYWLELSGRVVQGLRDGRSDPLVFFSFDAWAVKEARQCAEAWRRLMV